MLDIERDDKIPLYVYRDIKNIDEINDWYAEQGIDIFNELDRLHITQVCSRELVVPKSYQFSKQDLILNAINSDRKMKRFGTGEYLVLECDNPFMQERFKYFMNSGCSHDFDDYRPHISLSSEYDGRFEIEDIEPYKGNIILGPEKWRALRPKQRFFYRLSQDENLVEEIFNMAPTMLPYLDRNNSIIIKKNSYAIEISFQSSLIKDIVLETDTLASVPEFIRDSIIEKSDVNFIKRTQKKHFKSFNM